MRRNWIVFAVASLLCVPLAACRGESPPAPAPAAAAPVPAPAPAGSENELASGHPPLGARAAARGGQVLPPKPDAGVGEKGLQWEAPSGWLAEQPSSSMRRAQYRVPGPGGDAECVVFYFGPGEGGDAHSNAVRWAQQFRTPDGRPAVDALKTSETTVRGARVVLVEVAGAYQAGAGMGQPSGPDKPDSMLLGAIAEGPDANWFFKFVGPRATVAAQRAAFEQMVQSIKRGA